MHKKEYYIYFFHISASKRVYCKHFYPIVSHVSFLVIGYNEISVSLVSQKAQNNVILLGVWSSGRQLYRPKLLHGVNTGSGLGISPSASVGQASSGQSWVFSKFDIETRNHL